MARSRTGAPAPQQGGLHDVAVLRVVVVYVLARVPAAGVWLSIVLDVSTASGSYAAAGSAVGAYSVGVATCAPLVGRLADRVGARRVLLVCAALQLPALALLAGAAHAAGLGLLAPALLAGAVQPPLVPCMRASWAFLVPDERQRASCFTFDSVLGEVVDLAAPLLAVALNVARGERGSLVLVAVAVAVSVAAFTAVLPSAPRRAAPPRVRGRLRPVLPVLAVVLLVTAVLGAAEVGCVALADATGDRRAAGLLLATFTVGSIAGGVAWARRPLRSAPGLQLLLLLLPLGYGLLGAVLVPASVPLLVPLLVVAGLAVAPLVAVLLGLLQELAVRGSETETFTWGTTANYVGVALGSALAGLAGDGVGSVAGLGPGHAGLLVAMLLVVAAGGAVAVLSTRLPQTSAQPGAVAAASAGPRRAAPLPAAAVPVQRGPDGLATGRAERRARRRSSTRTDAA